MEILLAHRRHNMRYFASTLTWAVLTGCLAVSTTWGQKDWHQNSGKPLLEPFGLDLTAIDKRTRPQDDFYQYVNGAWIARTTFPADADQIDGMQDRVDARGRALLEAGGAASPGAGG